MVLFANPLTPRVKPWVTQSFPTIEYMDVRKLLSSTLLSCCLFFNFIQFVILKNFSILDLAQSAVKGLK